MSEIVPQLPPVVVPIFIPGDDDTFDFHGTGTAIAYRNRYFLATAAHVNDGNGKTDTLFVGQARIRHSLRELPPVTVCTPIPANLTRKEDHIDLAVIPISQEIAVGLSVIGAEFVEFDSVPPRIVQPNDLIYFAGFPYKRQHVFPSEGGDFSVEALTVYLRLKQVVAKEALALGFPVESHLVGRFGHPETRPPNFDQIKDRLDDPQGMSGGAIWHISGGTAAFVGINIRWNPDGNAGQIIGTRASLLGPLLEAAYKLSEAS